jgi:hypothetical protein
MPQALQIQPLKRGNRELNPFVCVKKVTRARILPSHESTKTWGIASSNVVEQSESDALYSAHLGASGGLRIHLTCIFGRRAWQVCEPLSAKCGHRNLILVGGAGGARLGPGEAVEGGLVS